MIANQERFHQESKPLALWSWTSRPLELWEKIHLCCLSYTNYSICMPVYANTIKTTEKKVYLYVFWNLKIDKMNCLWQPAILNLKPEMSHLGKISLLYIANNELKASLLFCFVLKFYVKRTFFIITSNWSYLNMHLVEVLPFWVEELFLRLWWGIIYIEM